MDSMAKYEEINGDVSSTITGLRKSIDEVDEKILGLINQRLLYAKKIGMIKKAKGNQVVDNQREVEIMKRLSSINKGPIRDSVLVHIFNDIIAESREIQKPQTVAFLGPEATFTHIAAMNHFGYSVSFAPQMSILEVFREVEKGDSNYGVVPVENSIEGAVNHTLDLFFESGLKICAEIYCPVSHDLLSVSGSLERIDRIFSHPQAFAQCRNWLRKYLPDVILEECSSTAHAAEKASREPGTAAVASSRAAQMYNLKVAAPKIQDFTHNVTRFLVIGTDVTHSTGADKTSVMFATVHAPGALHRVLEPVAVAGINMEKLESRPTKHENWNYFFFVDIEGHIEDNIVAETLNSMKPLCLYHKYLGSYPKVQI